MKKTTTKKAPPKKAAVKVAPKPAKKAAVKKKAAPAAKKPATPAPKPFVAPPVKPPVPVPAAPVIAAKPAAPVATLPPRAFISPPVVVPTPRIRQNGETRPQPFWSNGRPKVTFYVWETADKISAEKAAKAKAEGGIAKPPTRLEMLTRIGEENEKKKAEGRTAEIITYSVFQNQFYRWRRFNGVTGRELKNGKHISTKGGRPLKRKDGKPPGGEKPPRPIIPANAPRPNPPKPPALPFPVATVAK